jgi:hypothetical protein
MQYAPISRARYSQASGMRSDHLNKLLIRAVLCVVPVLAQAQEAALQPGSVEGRRVE